MAGAKKEIIAAFILVVFYAVGFYGLGFSNYKFFFLALVPFNLLLTNFILFLFHRSFTGAFWVFATIVFITGFLAEVLGVHTALLFGHYQYGVALGYQVFKVPLIIGLNWLMLVYASGHLVDSLLKAPFWVKALVAAALMVMLDYFIEPVAVKLDFWTWQDGQIPLSNFTGWFGVAFLLQLYFYKTPFLKNNKLAPFVFVIQFMFFAALSWVI